MTDEKPRIIRRYQNRKLYDTQDSRYVTLDDIALMIKEGRDIKVVDNKSKKDLTAMTLAQIIFEEEKKDKSVLPLSTLKKIIQSGSESIQDIVDRFFSPGVTSVQQAKVEVEKAIDRLVNRGKLKEEDRKHIIKELYSQSQKSMTDVARHVEDNLARFLDSLRPLANLQERIGDLETEVERLEKAVKAKKRGK